jgi:hypothetical protein
MYNITSKENLRSAIKHMDRFSYQLFVSNFALSKEDGSPSTTPQHFPFSATKEQPAAGRQQLGCQPPQQ